jgi:hypothetical protein
MSTSESSFSGAVPSQVSVVDAWWDRFLEHLSRQGVPKKQVPFYQLRVQRFLKHFPGVKSAALSAGDVETYLGEIDGLAGMPGWQRLQTLDAIQRFGAFAGLTWVGLVDWVAWRRRWGGDTNGAGPISVETIERGILPEDSALRDFAISLRTQQRSLRTEGTYLDWVERCQKFHRLSSAAELDVRHVAPFLEYLVVSRQVSANTQRQALNALVGFFRDARGMSEIDIGSFAPSRKPRQVPTVLSIAEVRSVVQAISDSTLRLMTALMYGAGLRVMELVRLRIKDLDFEHRMVLVMDGKGGGSRRTPMPESCVQGLLAQLERVKKIHAEDCQIGFGLASLPAGLSPCGSRPLFGRKILAGPFADGERGP